jgi:putative DNA primase/helicase
VSTELDDLLREINGDGASAEPAKRRRAAKQAAPSDNGEQYPGDQDVDIDVPPPPAFEPGDAAEPDNDPAPQPARPITLGREHETDLGNARLLVRHFGRDLRHCHPWKKDLVWDGRRWHQDNTGQLERWAKEVARILFREGLNAEGAERKKLVAHALKSESAKSIRATAALARSEPGVPVLPDDLDKDQWLLNCVNGTLDLRSGRLREHRREDGLTKLCPTAFRPGAPCPTWESFLARIFNGNGELVSYLRRVLGYCLTADTREHCLWILWGAGSNGKSTLLETVLSVLGPDYSLTAAPDLLLSKGDAHPTERADLFGRRFVVSVETDDGRRLAEGFVKTLTGGDRQRARRMREDFWEFLPSHKVFLCTNHKPQVRGTDHAMWRRLRLVPFTVTFWNPDDAEHRGRLPDGLVQDKALRDKLRAEAPGILDWCVRGCLEWQAEGLGMPDAVRAATAAYRNEQDLVAGFLAECCIEGSDFRCRRSDLYGRFERWCEQNGEAKGSNLPSGRKFGEALTDRGFERYTSNGTWYRGLTLWQDEEPVGD